MIFDIENWLWKSELCDLHGRIQNLALIYQRPLKQESAYFHSINPGFLVFNYSELHFSEVTFYKIHILGGRLNSRNG